MSHLLGKKKEGDDTQMSTEKKKKFGRVLGDY